MRNAVEQRGSAGNFRRPSEADPRRPARAHSSRRVGACLYRRGSLHTRILPEKFRRLPRTRGRRRLRQWACVDSALRRRRSVCRRSSLRNTFARRAQDPTWPQREPAASSPHAAARAPMGRAPTRGSRTIGGCRLPRLLPRSFPHRDHSRPLQRGRPRWKQRLSQWRQGYSRGSGRGVIRWTGAASSIVVLTSRRSRWSEKLECGATIVEGLELASLRLTAQRNVSVAARARWSS